jgi:hypothetical protein
LYLILNFFDVLTQKLNLGQNVNSVHIFDSVYIRHLCFSPYTVHTMVNFIHIFVMILCSVHARAQFTDHEDDREDALQGVEKTLAVKVAEPRGVIPPFVNNDTSVVVQITDDPTYAYVNLPTFHQLARNKTFRVWNKKILGENYTKEGSGLGQDGQGKKNDAVKANATGTTNGIHGNSSGAATNGDG